MNVQPHFYDAILKDSFRLRGKDFSDGDLIIYYEVGTPIGIPARPPLRRRLRLERGKREHSEYFVKKLKKLKIYLQKGGSIE